MIGLELLRDVSVLFYGSDVSACFHAAMWSTAVSPWCEWVAWPDSSLSNGQSFSLQLSWCASLHYADIHRCLNACIKFVFVSANTNMFVRPRVRACCRCHAVLHAPPLQCAAALMQLMSAYECRARKLAVKELLKLTWEDVMLAMWAITPLPVCDEGPFMETHETWLAESRSVRPDWQNRAGRSTGSLEKL